MKQEVTMKQQLMKDLSKKIKRLIHRKTSSSEKSKDVTKTANIHLQ